MELRKDLEGVGDGAKEGRLIALATVTLGEVGTDRNLVFYIPLFALLHRNAFETLSLHHFRPLYFYLRDNAQGGGILSTSNNF